MIIIKRKRVIALIGMVCFCMVFAVVIQNVTVQKTVQTMSLPVTNKVIVIDAGHGVPDEGAQSSSRNNGSSDEPKNSIKSTTFIRTKRGNCPTYQKR